MNERIRELVEQAAQEVRVGHNNAYWRIQDEIPEDAAWREKFAELIVRECITRIEGCATTPEDDEFVKGYNKGVSKVASQVKHHFGVE